MEKPSLGYVSLPCALGHALVAGTQRGVCFVRLGTDAARLEADLVRAFPAAQFQRPPPKHVSLWGRAIADYVDGRSDAYCLGLLLLDASDPTRVLARSIRPILEPDAEYEREGFFGGVVFTNGHVVDGLRITDYESAIVASFAELVKSGYIYRGLKPVNWCPKCETALAEAEVEYEDHASPSVFVKFSLKDQEEYLPDSHLVIWTTTPWTLIAKCRGGSIPRIFLFLYKERQGQPHYCRCADGGSACAGHR